MNNDKSVDLSGIKNIVFDLGNVILNVDYTKTIKAFEALGAVKFDSVYTMLAQTEIFNLFDRGLISPDEFRAGLRTALPALKSVSDRNIDSAWNAMLEDLPIERLDVLSRLKSKFRTFILSNTNEIHIESFNKTVAEVVPGKKLIDYFENIYYSNEIGFRKPDVEAYRFVLDKNGLIPRETLFIDDLEANIRGAERVGLKTFLLEKGFLTIVDLFHLPIF